MIKAKFSVWLGILLAAVMAAPAWAEEEKAPQPHVVIVGISNYADKDINPRPHAEDDAKALYDVLTSKEYLGVDADHVRLLLGSEDKERKAKTATKENILDAVKWLQTDAKPQDLVIFAYFGEGAAAGDRGNRCYLATDSTLKDRDKNAIPASSLGEDFDKCKANRIAVLIDVNFKGHKPQDGIPEPQLGSPPYKEFLGDDGTEEHSPVPGRVIFLATNGLSQSLDGDKHGIFTEAVLKGLKGEADKEGEPDGLITVDELAAYLKDQIPELAGKFGKTAQEKEQLHFVLGGAGTHFPLTTNPKVIGKVKERLTALEKLAADKAISAELATEGKELLSRMPKLESQRKLRKAYQELVDGKLTAAKFTAARDEILSSRKLSREKAEAYAKKVMDAVQLIRDTYVKETNAGELVNWGIRGLYRRLDEKVPADVQEKLAKTKTMTKAQLSELLADVRESLGTREDLDKGKDVDISLQRMMTHLDPYTTFYDKETIERIMTETSGNFKGVGIQIRSVNGLLKVVTPIWGSPAYKAGIQTGDVITRVLRKVDSEGKKLPKEEEIDVKKLPLDDVVKLIKGKEGTEVTLVVEREGEAKPMEFTVQRARIEPETVMGLKRKSDDSWDYYVDPTAKIAYIRLTEFKRTTIRDLEKVVGDLKKTGIKGMVLDLRFNPGGLLDSAILVSDLFIDDGLIVSIRERGKREQGYVGKHADSNLDFPMVCLINGQSASGAEIVAACLQDHKRAIIMGERSYGKGSVQNFYPLEEGKNEGELKMTIATYWRPSGKNINKSSTAGKDEDEWGVMPDKGHAIPLTRKERDDLEEAQLKSEIIPSKKSPTPKSDFKDRQLDEALKYLRGQIQLSSRDPIKKTG